MENKFYKEPKNKLSPQQAWDEFLNFKKEEGGLSRLLEKAVKYIFSKGYNKKIYPLDYSHQALRLLKTKDLVATRAEIFLFEKENWFVSPEKFLADYLIEFKPEGVKWDEEEKTIKKEFNEPELESILDEFIGELLKSRINGQG